MKAARIVASVLLGVVIAMLVVGLVEMLGLAFHPLPDNVRDMTDAELNAHAEAAPFAAKLVVVGAWCLGAFSGSWIAGRVAGPGLHWFGALAGAILFAGCLFSLFTIPSPAWMWVLGLVLPAGGAVAGSRLARWPVEPDDGDDQAADAEAAA